MLPLKWRLRDSVNCHINEFFRCIECRKLYIQIPFFFSFPFEKKAQLGKESICSPREHIFPVQITVFFVFFFVVFFLFFFVGEGGVPEGDQKGSTLKGKNLPPVAPFQKAIDVQKVTRKSHKLSLKKCWKWTCTNIYPNTCPQSSSVRSSFDACTCKRFSNDLSYCWFKLTLVMLNPDIPCLCKQCRSRSVGFWRSQLIWICTVCHSVCEFISTIWTKLFDWLTIRNGWGILIYSAWEGLKH